MPQMMLHLKTMQRLNQLKRSAEVLHEGAAVGVLSDGGGPNFEI